MNPTPSPDDMTDDERLFSAHLDYALHGYGKAVLSTGIAVEFTAFKTDTDHRVAT